MQTETLLQLRQVAPLHPLSDGGLKEISRLGRIAAFPRGSDLLAEPELDDCTFFLLDGQLRVDSARNGAEVMVGGTSSSAALRKSPDLLVAEPITEVRLLCIETDRLDVTLIWDQLNEVQSERSRGVEPLEQRRHHGSPGTVAEHLLSGALAALTPDRVALLLERFEPVSAKRGEVILREGDPGDHYYVIDDGRCLVTRRVGNTTTELAELRPGDGFGEEALLGNGIRNATITMKRDGRLYRLARADFDALLREPLLRQLSAEQALEKRDSAIWIDVRFPSEFNRDRLSWSINIPLGEIRHVLPVLDRSCEYVVHCQNGSRSAAAAFLLAQAGCRAFSLQGGLDSLAALSNWNPAGK